MNAFTSKFGREKMYNPPNLLYQGFIKISLSQ